MDTLPPKRETAKLKVIDDEPTVALTPQDRFYDLIEREQKPANVRATLTAALNGDMHELGLLFQSMLDSWPRMQTNIDEVLTKVAKAPFKVEPFAAKGEDPTERAIEKAEAVEDILKGMTSDPTRSESDFGGLIRDIGLGYYTGHSVSEVYWRRGEKGAEIKATKDIPWRFIGYPSYQDDSDRLMLAPKGLYQSALIDFPEHKFLIAVRKAHKGHATVAAPLRALTQYWLAATYGLKWLLSFAQIYGVPLRIANYTDSKDLAKVSTMLQNLGSSGWGAFPKGVDIDIKEAAKSAGDLPQALLLENADKACDIFILGQTLTTDTSSSGSRALGDVHADVRMDKLQAVADFVSATLNTQAIPSILELNFGDTEEAPTITLDFPKPKDEKALAERDRVLHSEMGLPVEEEELYKRHGVKIPEEGAKLFSPPSPKPNGPQGDPEAGDVFEPHETKAARVRVARQVIRDDRRNKRALIEAYDANQKRAEQGRSNGGQWVSNGDSSKKKP